MTGFQGFPEGKMRLTPVPGPFFTELLPEIDHLGELKVTLYVFWRLDRMEGAFRTLKRADFAADSRLMQSLGKTRREAETALDDALERAVGRGTLLRAVLHLESGDETYYFLNSARGRAAVEAIQQGKWRPSAEANPLVELNLERPNIFRLYEEHIGPLSPMIAEVLRDAEDNYPQEWIEDSFRIAVENNVRKWRYIEAILRSWKEEGRDEQNRRDSEEDRYRYSKGEFSDFIEH